MMLERELPMPSHLLEATPEVDKKKKNQNKQDDKKAQAKKLEEGALVWLFNPTNKVGRCPK